MQRRIRSVRRKDLSPYLMDLPTKELGLSGCAMVMEDKRGPTGPFMLGHGVTTRQMEKAGFSTLMGMCMMENGSMIRLMVSEPILMQMELATKENGKKTDSMDLELKPGLMDPVMKDNTQKERSMVKGSYSSAMEAHTKGIS